MVRNKTTRIDNDNRHIYIHDGIDASPQRYRHIAMPVNQTIRRTLMNFSLYWHNHLVLEMPTIYSAVCLSRLIAVRVTNNTPLKQ